MEDPRIEELRDLKADIASMEAIRRRLVKRYEDLTADVVESYLIDEWHCPTREQTDITTKMCGASPVGVCVFHNVRDPKHEQCFFCHSSEEDVTTDASHSAGNP